MREAVDIGQRGHVLWWGAGDRVIRVSPSEPGDQHRFDARGDFLRDLRAEGGRLPKGPRWTLETGAGRREVLGVGGLEDQGGGRWAAWGFLSDMKPRQWLVAGWAAHAVLTWARKGLEARTIVAIPAPTLEAVRLLKRIGFVDVGEPYMVWEG